MRGNDGRWTDDGVDLLFVFFAHPTHLSSRASFAPTGVVAVFLGLFLGLPAWASGLGFSPSSSPLLLTFPTDSSPVIKVVDGVWRYLDSSECYVGVGICGYGEGCGISNIYRNLL